MSRPQILFLAHRVPFPPNRGDRIRSFHLIAFLAERADVHLAFLAQEGVKAETIRALQRHAARVAGVPLARAGRWVRAAWSLATGRTATEGLFASAGLRRTLQAWAARTRFDAVVVYCSSMAQYLDVPGLDGVPAIIDLVDVDSQKWFDYASIPPRPAPRSPLPPLPLRRFSLSPLRLLFRLEGRRLRRLERALADRAFAITLVSQREADLYRSFCPATHVYAIPNGVDLDYFRPWGEGNEAASGPVGERVGARGPRRQDVPVSFSSPPTDRRPPAIVFVGALDYRANLDGLAWFCRHVWPEVRRRLPEATFRLVGSRPGSAARRIGRIEGVELVGEVPDVRPYLADATVVVAPLRVARGIQNKVLEALAMQKAVVASPQALEGLAVEPGEHLLSADTPEAWVNSIIDLFQRPDLGARLAAAGRRYVEEHYDWNLQLNRLASLPGLCDLLPRVNGQPVKSPAGARG